MENQALDRLKVLWEDWRESNHSSTADFALRPEPMAVLHFLHTEKQNEKTKALPHTLVMGIRSDEVAGCSVG